ncbi:MAG: class I SAM-dependent methyltransferase [Planctomycetaceae bacterium]
MNPQEYEIMAGVEHQHWWYRSLRQLTLAVIQKHLRRSPDDLSILDAGCGTGENLRFLAECFPSANIDGFDASETAIAYAREKSPGADIYQSDICSPELRRKTYDIVISCDVICIPGFSQAEQGLQTIISRINPGGLLLLNLPAYNWLRSEHDLAVHSTERFTRSIVNQAVRRSGLEICVSTYRLCLLFPLVLLSRLPSILMPRRSTEEAVSALKPPSNIANSVLGTIQSLEHRWISGGLTCPFGSSVFVVARKPADPTSPQ